MTASKPASLVWEGRAAGGRELTAQSSTTSQGASNPPASSSPPHLCAQRAVEPNPPGCDAWDELGEVAQCVGRRDEARMAYQEISRRQTPEDGERSSIWLIALRDDAPPPRASDRAIQHIYKSFAASGAMDARRPALAGPERMKDALGAVIGDQGGPAPAGGSPGLWLWSCRRRDEPRAADLTGADLSPRDGRLWRGAQYL